MEAFVGPLMTMGCFGVVFLVFFGLAIWSFMVGGKQEKLRKAELFSYCAQRKWEFRELFEKVWYGSDHPLLRGAVSPDFIEIWPMRDHSRAKLRMQVEGDVEGIPMEAFEMSYVVSSGKSSTTYYHTVMAIRQKTPIGRFELTEMGFGDVVSKMFGGQDISCGDEVFDERFRVKGNEILAVKELFHEGTRLLCMRQQGLRLAGSGDLFMVIKQGRMDAGTLHWMAEFLHRFWDEIPEGWRKESVRRLGVDGRPIMPPPIEELRVDDHA